MLANSDRYFPIEIYFACLERLRCLKHRSFATNSISWFIAIATILIGTEAAKADNVNDAVVVDFDNSFQFSIAPGNPSESYGFIRFRVKVQ